MSFTRDGEMILNTRQRIVVRGHLSAEEMRRLTGWSGDIRHAWWRHAYSPLRQRQLIEVPRGRFVESRKGKARARRSINLLKELV